MRTCPSSSRVIRFRSAVSFWMRLATVTGWYRASVPTAADRGAALGLLRLFGGGDGGVHRGVDPLGVPPHPRFGVVPDEDRLAEGDLVAELPGALVRGVGGGRVPVGFVGEGVGPGLLPGGAVGLHDCRGPGARRRWRRSLRALRRGVSRRCR